MFVFTSIRCYFTIFKTDRKIYLLSRSEKEGSEAYYRVREGSSDEAAATQIDFTSGSERTHG